MNELRPRPDPDALLAAIHRDEKAAQRGRLKIFFGMCPGVGKTCAMLQAAHEKLLENVPVLVGIVESHGRPETEALLNGLEILPKITRPYRGTDLQEMDLDAILARHPSLVLVDELAHTNAPGSRHTKRFHDVLEILENGIDVFTTVNVQHIDSRCDTVREITGVEVRETVPDSILDIADEIVLIDLTPEQLRERLEEGKVYQGTQATIASEKFFREGNLTALREMALRVVAEHVDRDLRDFLRKEGLDGPWKSSDRLLVGVSSNPFSEHLIRYTRRLASSMEASWLAVNIESKEPLDPARQTRLMSFLSLARQLGGEVIQCSGLNSGQTLLQIAKAHNVSQIVLGKPQQTLWSRFQPSRSPVDWLLRESGGIDLLLVSHTDSEHTSEHPGGLRTKPKLHGYLIASGILIIITGLCLLCSPPLHYGGTSLVYLLAVIFAAIRLPRGPIFLLALGGLLIWDFVFLPARWSFVILERSDQAMFVLHGVVALLIAHFGTHLGESLRTDRRRQKRATAHYRLIQALTKCRNLDEVIRVAVEQVRDSITPEVAVLLHGPTGLVQHPSHTFELSSKEMTVAALSFRKMQVSGQFSDTIPDAEAMHIPLISGENCIGILSLKLLRALSMEQQLLLDTLVPLTASFIEKEQAITLTRKTPNTNHASSNL